jgi:hypothetical protein
MLEIRRHVTSVPNLKVEEQTNTRDLSDSILIDPLCRNTMGQFYQFQAVQREYGMRIVLNKPTAAPKCRNGGSRAGPTPVTLE